MTPLLAAIGNALGALRRRGRPVTHRGGATGRPSLVDDKAAAKHKARRSR